MNTPKWLAIAVEELCTGIGEVPGDGDNPRIVEYHSATSLKATDDEVSWCSSFANWCMKQGGIEGTHNAAARSWMQWGRGLSQPRVGCIVVFKRGTSAWQGHVAFYLGTTALGNLVCLGGNQSDRVSVTVLLKESLLGYRWPDAP